MLVIIFHTVWADFSHLEQPDAHLPLAEKLIVFLLSGRSTGTFTASIKLAVLVLGRGLPLWVAASFAWEAMTDVGRIT